MAIETVLLPNIGDFKDSKVIEVLVNVGDQVEYDQSLIVLESDKASMEVPSAFAGKITAMKIKEGDVVNVGDAIAEIEADKAIEAPVDKEPENVAETPAKKEEDNAVAPPPKDSTKSTEQQAEASIKPTVNQQKLGAKYHASPMIRQFANRLGANLGEVQGSGPKGRILREDVEAWVKNILQGRGASGGVGSALPKPPVVDFSQFGEIESIELSRIQKISGQHLSACWLNVPHVTQLNEVSIDELEQYRTEHNSKIANKKKAVKLTPLAFFIKATSKAMDDFPRFNSSLGDDGQTLILKKYLNIGVAVDTPNGLVVPVIREVRDKGVQQLASELVELSEKARAGTLSANEMQGGCFTISSLGGIGGSHFTPIINLPEVAILGVGKAITKPFWNGEEFEPKLILPFSVSYDHRVIDGAEGARFVVKLAEYLNDLRNILL
jgi:pyruvate dehydrogenase E2 component (dihydrolipoamide acetyltransferase)